MDEILVERVKVAYEAHSDCEWTHPVKIGLPENFPGFECKCGVKTLNLGPGRAYFDIVLNTFPPPLILPASGSHSLHLVEHLTLAVFDDPTEGDRLRIFDAWNNHSGWHHMYGCECAKSVHSHEEWLDHMASRVAAVAGQPTLL